MPPISCTSKCRWPQRALGRLAHGGEGRHQQVVERDAVGELLAERRGARPQLGVREALQLRLQRVDGLDMWADRS